METNSVFLWSVGFVELDAYIAPLVEVLRNKLNVKTLYSCQGHLNKVIAEDFDCDDWILLAKYPWIIFEKSNVDVVESVITKYNQKFSKSWQISYNIEGAVLSLPVDPKDKEELFELQKEAIELAIYLKNSERR